MTIEKLIKKPTTSIHRFLFAHFGKGDRPEFSEPIYHYHVRKSGGTSINHAFYASASEDLGKHYNQIMRRLWVRRIRENNKTYVLNDLRLIASGNYFYAHSHYPYDDFKLPDFVRRITCLRDPIKRVISHYKMLLEYDINRWHDHPTFIKEGHWIKGGLEGFISTMPRENLENQLYMFSKRYDSSEAFERLSKFDYICLTDTLDNDLDKMGEILGVKINARHDRISQAPFEPSQSEIDMLYEKMHTEIELFSTIRKFRDQAV